MLPSLSDIEAIDFHVHAERSHEEPVDERTQEYWRAAATYFRTGEEKPFLEEVAQYYRERSMLAVIFPVDSRSGTGQVPVPNREVLEAAERHNDVLIPFVSVDPFRGKEGLDELEALLQSGARGVKFHPNLQGFFPNDRPLAYRYYEKIEAAGAIALFHTGHSGIGTGMPGGGGVRLKFSNPMDIDDVAVDFPEMPIVLAHPSFPWQEEALSVAMHKPTVYIDLSGWSPKYFPPILIQYINTQLSNKVLFGSDYSMLKPDRWLRDFDKTDIRAEHREAIVKGNAARLLGLEVPGEES